MNETGIYRVLIADDEESLRFVLHELLKREGCDVEEAVDGADALEKARTTPYDLYLLDMKMPRMDGLTALRSIREIYPDALAVMITAFGSQQMAIEALKAGAYDYFTKPFNMDELRVVLMRALEKQALLHKLNELRERIGAAQGMGRLIGESPAARRVYRQIEQAAAHDVTVMISGQSGSGKELVAEAIHERSVRSKGPLIKVNCAAIPEHLLESELFGHERGAFTGAVCAKPGKFELADGGTIFLDEVGELPLALQSKLLRVLQEHQIDRVGGSKPREVDIRVLTATNRDLRAMADAGEFRSDLYYRLNVFPMELPSLRERMEDMPALVQHFIGQFNLRFGKRVSGVSPEAMALLERHPWPGNIRELENTIQRAMVLTAGPMIGREALPELWSRSSDASGTMRAGVNLAAANGKSNGGGWDGVDRRTRFAAPTFDKPLAETVEAIVEEVEREVIRAALEKMSGRRQESADLLGISRKSLHNKMVKYGMFAGGGE